MPGFDAAPITAAPEDPVAAARNARYGLILFAVYCAIYAGFVALNAFWPQTMSATVAGVNLAVVYGMGLIASALVLALLYCWLCRSPGKYGGAA